MKCAVYTESSRLIFPRINDPNVAMCYAAFFPFADCVRMTQNDVSEMSENGFILTKKKLHIDCRLFYRQTRNFAAVQCSLSPGHI